MPGASGSAASALSGLFKAADANADGSVSSDEAKALQSKVNDARSTLLSLQEDGGGSAPASGGASAASDITSLFSAMDADGDGSVSTAEQTSFATQADAATPPPRAHGHHHREGTSGAAGPDAGATGSAASDSSTSGAIGSGDSGSDSVTDTLMKLLDTDGSGSITKTELSAYMQKMMTQMTASFSAKA